MKVEENVKLCKLFDLYGKLLSKGQQEILNFYLFDDLTLTEIAENLNISRQAVNDSITKGEEKLKLYEEQLRFLERSESYQKEIANLREQLSKSKKED